VNTKVIIAAVIAVVVIGVGGFLVFGSGDDNTENTQANASSERTENSSFNQLLARGENGKCTYDYTDDAGNRSYGTAYFSQDKMFGDFTNVTAEGMTYQANVIRNGDTQYVWEKDSNEGYKTNVTESTEESQTETSETIDPDQNYEFKCVSWTVDNSMFEVPSDVTFTDLGAQIQEAQEQVQEAVESACAQIADPTARAACEASLPN
jgi:hypothetical protein